MIKVLVLDESGTIDSNYKTENYFVLGGILYDLDNFELIKSKLLPPFATYKKILKAKELKSSKLTSSKNLHNLIYGAVLGIINSIAEIKPIIYILIKNKSYLINSYDKKSFMYNKLIEFLVGDLIHDKLIDNEDKLIILLDRFDLNENEFENITNWLPSNVRQVDRVELASSEDFSFIQAADLISGIPKLKGTSPRLIKADPKIKILSNCYLHVFPKSHASQILADVSTEENEE